MSAPRGRHRAPSRVLPTREAAEATVVPLRPVTDPGAVAVLDASASGPAVPGETYLRLVAMYRRGVECNAELVERLDAVCEERDELARRVRELEDKSFLYQRLRAARLGAAFSQSKQARAQSGAEPHLPGSEARRSS